MNKKNNTVHVPVTNSPDSTIPSPDLCRVLIYPVQLLQLCTKHYHHVIKRRLSDFLLHLYTTQVELRISESLVRWSFHLEGGQLVPKHCIVILQYLHLCQHLSQLELPALERTNIKLCQPGGGGGEVGPLCEKRIKTTEGQSN